MKNTDARIDAFIARSAPFAQPILIHLREMVHLACPEVNETIKWGMPSFEYGESILCGMAAFKNHCSFSFWRGSALTDPHNVLQELGEKSGMGHFGKMTDISQLPDDKILIEYIQEAMKLNEKGVKALPKTRVKKTTPATITPPDYFLEKLKETPEALATFTGFSPSHKREYIEWITEAKTEATRHKRMLQAIQWMAEGKPRNWKYMKEYR